MGDQLRVLVTGGSGYLGQFIICGLCSSYNVGYTYFRQPVPHPPGVSAFLANIATGQGLTDAVLSFKPAVVINCAALSQPAACERDYEACKAVNVPVKLVEALRQLEQQNSITSLLIQLSTDQASPAASRLMM
jgi:dTDP-4-dehydrorhamnose reductase